MGLFFLDRLSTELSYKLAKAISDLQYFFSFCDKRAVMDNLKSILPATNDIHFQTREVFRNFGRYLIEFFQMNRMLDDHFVKNRVHKRGLEHLDKVLAEGKGGIVITAHIGNWELGAVLLSVLGYPLMVVALPHKERPVNDLFNQRREGKGVTVVPTNTALRRCIQQLKENKFIALVADRDFSANGMEMDFLGRKAQIPKGAAVFSLKTGAPIIPVFLIRNNDGTFDLSCHKPIYPSLQKESDVNDTVVAGVMCRYLSVIEDQIRSFPSQWLLFRKFYIQ